jgi:CheY-like chemotaxis protein
MKEQNDLKKRILVADDNRTLVQLVSEILRHEGYAVLTAFDGLEALRKARSERPDLIIMDLDMHKMDGYAACRVLQSSPVTASIPVLMLTGKGQVEPSTAPKDKWTRDKGIQERMEAFESGALEFLSKPIMASELLEQVRKVLALVNLGFSSPAKK